MIVNTLVVQNNANKYKISAITEEQLRNLEYAVPKKYAHVSRYGNVRRILDKYNGIYYHETVSDYKVSEGQSDTFITVSKTTNRLDVISNNVYGTPTYWWVIALANNIIDSFAEIPVGTVIRIPQLLDLYSKGNVLEK